MAGRILFIVGLAGMVLGAGVLGVSLLLPVVTDGRTSWNEALLGIVPGAACSFLSFVLALVGLFLVLSEKKK